MAAHYPAPIQEDVRDLLHDLLGRSVVVDKTTPLELDEDRPGLVAVYVTDTDDVAALIVTDVRFACAAGGALSMVPPPVVEESIRKGVVAENLLENAYEVLNICSRFFNSPSTPHLKLRALHPYPGDLSPHEKALLSFPEFRRDFAVLVEGYGDGRCSVLVA